MAGQEPPSGLTAPLRTALCALRRVAGAGLVGRVAAGTLDAVGTSPRGRRIAVYTGAGLLGVAGVVERPVALTGAAVAWLTQPRSEEHREPQERASAGRAEDAAGPADARSGVAPATSPGGRPEAAASRPDKPVRAQPSNRRTRPSPETVTRAPIRGTRQWRTVRARGPNRGSD